MNSTEKNNKVFIMGEIVSEAVFSLTKCTARAFTN